MSDAAKNRHHSQLTKDRIKAARDFLTPQQRELITRRTKEVCCKSVRCIDTGEVFSSVREAAERFGVPESSISSTINGTQLRAAGLRWEALPPAVEESAASAVGEE